MHLIFQEYNKGDKWVFAWFVQVKHIRVCREIWTYENPKKYFAFKKIIEDLCAVSLNCIKEERCKDRTIEKIWFIERMIKIWNLFTILYDAMT